ncbi:MAG: hypothetical protein IKE18_07640 [Oscillospiraceae bacterium]|nr:hypothetical protein [Oscillospiraceae bacterium]
MFKKLIATGGIVIMALGLFTGCFGRSYTIGKNPKLEEITSITAGGGGMDYSSQWSYSARRSSKDGKCELNRVFWDDSINEMKDITVEISGYEYEKIIHSVEGLKYVKYSPPKNVMDGSSESVRIYWPDSPSGSYRIDFGETGMRDLMYAFTEVWDANAYKANDPVDVTGITYFSFGFGPTDIAEGDARYTAEIDKESGEVILTYKESGPFDEKTVTADPSFMDEIVKIIKENGADRWDGFSGNDSWVMDGSAFSLFVASEDGILISAGGRENYPDGFGKFNQDLEKLYGTVFN